MPRPCSSCANVPNGRVRLRTRALASPVRAQLTSRPHSHVLERCQSATTPCHSTMHTHMCCGCTPRAYLADADRDFWDTVVWYAGIGAPAVISVPVHVRSTLCREGSCSAEVRSDAHWCEVESVSRRGGRCAAELGPVAAYQKARLRALAMSLRQRTARMVMDCCDGGCTAIQPPRVLLMLSTGRRRGRRKAVCTCRRAAQEWEEWP